MATNPEGIAELGPEGIAELGPEGIAESDVAYTPWDWKSRLKRETDNHRVNCAFLIISFFAEIIVHINWKKSIKIFQKGTNV